MRPVAAGGKGRAADLRTTSTWERRAKGRYPKPPYIREGISAERHPPARRGGRLRRIIARPTSALFPSFSGNRYHGDVVAYARSSGDPLPQGRRIGAANSARLLLPRHHLESIRTRGRAPVSAAYLGKTGGEAARHRQSDFGTSGARRVIQYIYRRLRPATIGGQICGGPSSHIIPFPRHRAEVGQKALGLTPDVTARLPRDGVGLWRRARPDNHIRQAGLDSGQSPAGPASRSGAWAKRSFNCFRANISQHPSAVSSSRARAARTFTGADRHARHGRSPTFIEGDQRGRQSDNASDLMKVDCASALGMLSCIPGRWADICESSLTGKGLFRSQRLPEEARRFMRWLSRAESSACSRSEKPRADVDAAARPGRTRLLLRFSSLRVRIVRPGPIQGDSGASLSAPGGDKIRKGEHYPSPGIRHGPADELEAVMKRTLGVPRSRNRAMQIATTAARNYLPDEGRDGLRRGHGGPSHTGNVHRFRRQVPRRH